jgi:hypothetical protein
VTQEELIGEKTEGQKSLDTISLKYYLKTKCMQGKLLVGSMGWSNYSTVDPSITQVTYLTI